MSVGLSNVSVSVTPFHCLPERIQQRSRQSNLRLHIFLLSRGLRTFIYSTCHNSLTLCPFLWCGEKDKCDLRRRVATLDRRLTADSGNKLCKSQECLDSLLQNKFSQLVLFHDERTRNDYNYMNRIGCRGLPPTLFTAKAKFWRLQITRRQRGGNNWDKMTDNTGH
jgi:hypothetical protein